jgi:hypothetical protein
MDYYYGIMRTIVHWKISEVGSCTWGAAVVLLTPVFGSAAEEKELWQH